MSEFHVSPGEAHVSLTTHFNFAQLLKYDLGYVMRLIDFDLRSTQVTVGGMMANTGSSSTQDQVQHAQC